MTPVDQQPPILSKRSAVRHKLAEIMAELKPDEIATYEHLQQACDADRRLIQSVISPVKRKLERAGILIEVIVNTGYKRLLGDGKVHVVHARHGAMKRKAAAVTRAVGTIAPDEFAALAEDDQRSVNAQSAIAGLVEVMASQRGVRRLKKASEPVTGKAALSGLSELFE